MWKEPALKKYGDSAGSERSAMLRSNVRVERQNL